MNIQKNIPLAPYTTFKIGGPAKFFVEAKDEDEIVEALEFAKEKNLPVFILGGGSNLLVSDKGFGGLVIKMSMSGWKLNFHDGSLASKIECDSGCLLSKIVNESVKNGLIGLEWAAGIPGGTIGGAVRGNAGAFGGTMGEIVESVKVLEIPNFSKARLFPSSSRALRIPQSQAFPSRDCKFAYRDSIFKNNSNLVILSATLKLKKGDKAEGEKKIKEILAKRKEKQPMEFPSPGSFFKNPETDKKELIRQFETDTRLRQGFGGQAGQKIGDEKIPAGYLIDQLDLRGKKIGGAMVSEKHANFIVNTGNATAEDVIMLAAIIKTKVRNKFGIQLQEEVQMVGF